MNEPIKILITGDTYLGSGRIKHLATHDSQDQLFGEFAQKIKKADLSITNLESPLIDNGDPILKTGPNLKSPVETLPVLKDTGFNLLTLANNHIMDYGREGLVSTIEACSQIGLHTVGAGMNIKKKQKSFLQEINGIKIGIINIAENEFNTLSDGAAGAHALHPVRNYYRIKETCKIADYIIVIIHGGHEGYPFPSPRMKETYRFFIDAGASAVIGHHPHCYSGYEIYKDAPIFYSLGNFLFDKREAHPSWNKGFMVELIINKKLQFETIPYVQNNGKVGLQTLKEPEYLRFKRNINKINDIIADDEQLEEKFQAFCESSSALYNAYIEPHSNRYLHALRKRGFFPSLLNNRKKRLLLNLIRCESHRDILQNILPK
jgi:poly-gamma-glutamate synthesis protein (capsule biosynthesis protein)